MSACGVAEAQRSSEGFTRSRRGVVDTCGIGGTGERAGGRRQLRPAAKDWRIGSGAHWKAKRGSQTKCCSSPA
jgi:hypothetical protein